MADGAYRKKLIEVALPLDAINAESAREKSIRHGHLSTLHLWWARRPLAACRAVLFAQLVDDPSAHPEQFPTEEAQDVERQRLFAIIEDLVKWENSTNESVLEAARAEIRRSCNGNPPPILDPFAGGGSIPLEAQRLGLEAHASDLNPVAVLINKALIEIPPRWADRPPIHPEAENRTRWHGAEGLAEDVRRYGKWMRDEAERRIGHLYPKATLPDGSTANVIAWIWARTITCPNPACGVMLPLLSTFWLGKKKGKEAVLIPRPEGKNVKFNIGPPSSTKASEGNAGEQGVSCFVCKETFSLANIRVHAKEFGLGAQLLAVVAEGKQRRHYLLPDAAQLSAVEGISRPHLPEVTIPDRALGFRIAAYGLETYSDLFSDRQALLLFELFQIFQELTDVIRPHLDGREEQSAYLDAILTYIALAVSRFSGRSSTLCIWLNQPKNEGIANVFTRPTLSMNWDFAEANPFSSSSGNLEDNFVWVGRVIEGLPALGNGSSSNQRDARAVDSQFHVVSTDPPYYDNVGYADLSDYFYAALRAMLGPVYPDLFATVQTPKTDELISDPSKHASLDHSNRYFESGFGTVFSNIVGSGRHSYPMTLFYAFKQVERKSEALISTGWSTILEGLLSAGWMVTATWPVRTERPGRMRANSSNALASAIVLACRPRLSRAEVTDRQGFLRILQSDLSRPLRELQKANIAPATCARRRSARAWRCSLASPGWWNPTAHPCKSALRLG